MAPRTEQYKEFNKRIRRTLHYGDQRIFTLTLPLSEMIVEYFSLYPTKDPFSMEFAVNLSKESCLEPCTMLVAMIYIDRIRKSQLDYFEKCNACELYLASLIVASKYLHDSAMAIYNNEWANLVGQSTSRINEMEIELLEVMGWEMFISFDQFKEATESMEEWIASYNLRTNHSSTYSDLLVLSKDGVGTFRGVKDFLTCLSVFTTAYLASFIMLSGSSAWMSDNGLVGSNEIQSTSEEINVHGNVVAPNSSQILMEFSDVDLLNLGNNGNSNYLFETLKKEDNEPSNYISGQNKQQDYNIRALLKPSIQKPTCQVRKHCKLFNFHGEGHHFVPLACG